MTTRAIADVARGVKALGVCLVLVITAALAAGVEDGRACSCIPPDPWALLKQADGAFVGRLTDREEIGDGRARLTFSVERAVKSRIGSSVDVVTANNGAACGIETTEGQRIGLFLTREGGRWIGSLCAQVSPEDLLAAAALPAPNGRGPVAMFVGGRFGPARTVALDGHGRTLAYGLGRGPAALISPCPGGRTVAEIARIDGGVRPDVRIELAVRDANTLRVTRRQILDLPGRRFAEGLLCETAAGTSVVVFAGWPGDSALRAALYRVANGRLRTVWAGTAFLSSFGPSAAYLRAGFATDRFVKVDLRTGRVVQLARLPLSPALVPDRSGTLFAGAAYRLDRRSRFFILDLRRASPSVRSVPLAAPEVVGDTIWVSKERLLFLPVGGKEVAKLLDLRLRTLEEFRWTARQGVLARSTAFGITTRALVRARLPSGPQRLVRRLPGSPWVIATAR